MAIRRSHRILLQRVGIAALFVLLIMYLRSVAQTFRDNEPDFDFQQKILDLAQPNIALTHPNERVLVFGSGDSKEFRGIKHILDAYENVGIKYATVDSTDYAQKLHQRLQVEPRHSEAAFVALDNRVLGTYNHLVYLNSLGILEETVERNKIPLSSKQDPKIAAMQDSKKPAPEQPGRVGNSINDFIDQNKVALFVSPSNTPSKSLAELLDNYKATFGLQYKSLWKNTDDSDFTSVTQELVSRSNYKHPFPSLYVDSKFVGSINKIMELHYSSQLLNLFVSAGVIDDSLVQKAAKNAENKLESTLRKNRFVIISDSKGSLVEKIQKKVIEMYGRQQLDTIYVEDISNTFPIKALFQKLSIPHQLPVIFVDGKIVANGKNTIKNLLKDDKLFSSSEKPAAITKRKLGELISQSKVMVFSKTYCPFCKKAKGLLENSGIEYKVLEVDLQPNAVEIKELLTDISGGHGTFPSIFVNNKSIGGSSELELLLNQGKLHEMLNISTAQPGPPTKKLLLQLINKNKIMMFSKTYCPFCQKAKAILKRHDIKYDVFEADLQPNTHEIKSWLAEISGGQATFPNIFINGKSIGGSSDLENLSDSGQLLKMI